MTQDELDALPENGGIGFRKQIIDGREVDVPFMRPALALFVRDDDPAMVRDSDGNAWIVGWANGQRYKSRLSI